MILTIVYFWLSRHMFNRHKKFCMLIETSKRMEHGCVCTLVFLTPLIALEPPTTPYHACIYR